MLKTYLKRNESEKTNVLRENGLSEKAVNIFINEIKRNHIDMHSFSIYRNGKTVYSMYGYPYNRETMHRMYSSGKMLAALAVLKAADEGKLSLEDRVVTFFENQLPDSIDEKYEQLLVKHMLTMNTGHSYDTMKTMREDKDWVYGFFKQELDFVPGTKFFYNNGVPYILTQVVKKATGIDYLEYLNETFFREMDIYVVGDKNPQGETDPSGISIRICDFEKLPVLLLNKGKWNEKQLISAEAVQLMGMYHSPSIQNPSIQNVNIDTKFGYGYLLWRNSVGGYRLDGGRGQFGFVFPDLNMTVSIMAAEEDQGIIPELFWKYVYSYIWSGEAPENTMTDQSAEYRALPVWTKKCDDLTEVDGCSYVFEKNELGINKVGFLIEDYKMRVSFIQDEKEVVIYAGMEGEVCANKEMIRVPEPDWFMNHVSGNEDHRHYIVGRYDYAQDFMRNKEIVIFVRNLDKSMYDILSFRIANHAIRMEWAHGAWQCVKMRGRLEILPHIPMPVMIVGKKEDEDGTTNRI